jgi:hypothetical protein
VRTIEQLLEWKSSGWGLENQDKQPWEFVALTTQHPLPAKVGDFADKRSVGIVRLRTTATKFSLVYVWYYQN